MIIFGFIREKVLPFLATLKIEPFVFIFVLSLNISDIPSTQLIQDKICRLNFNRTAEYCIQISDEDDDSDDKTEILAYLAQYSIYKTVISSLPALIFSLFMGPWIDSYLYGRKILLCIGSLGFALSYVVLILSAVYFDLDVLYILLAAAIPAMTGAGLGVWLAMFSYISSNSGSQYRVIRFALFEICSSTAGPLGLYIGGHLLGDGYLRQNGSLYDYNTAFITSFVGCIIAFLWVIFVIKEKVPDIEVNSALINSEEVDSVNNNEKSSHLKNNVKDTKFVFHKMFDINNVKDVIRTSLKPRPNKGRAQIWLLYLAMCTLGFCDAKNSAVVFPYIEEVFHWDSEYYSTFKSIANILSIITFAIMVPVLSGLFKIKDTKLGLIGLVSMFSGALMLGSVISPIGIYLTYAFGCLSGTVGISVRSLLSKIATDSEIGKIYCLLSSLETVIPSICVTFYSTIFDYSIKFYPSLSFQIGASFIIIPLSILMWIDLTRIQFY